MSANLSASGPAPGEAAAAFSLLDRRIASRAARDALVKLNPRQLARNPVIFVTEVVALLTTVLGVRALFQPAGAQPAFALAIAAWLWLTVLFATFAEAMAEGRGTRAGREPAARPQETLREAGAEPGRAGAVRHRVLHRAARRRHRAGRDQRPDPARRRDHRRRSPRSTRAPSPASRPRHPRGGGDRSAVTGGTQVVSDSLLVRITAAPATPSSTA